MSRSSSERVRVVTVDETGDGPEFESEVVAANTRGGGEVNYYLEFLQQYLKPWSTTTENTGKWQFLTRSLIMKTSLLFSQK